MCNIIGDVHQFIGHCLIPLDPWAPYPCGYFNHIPIQINIIQTNHQKYVYKIYGRNDLKHIVTHSKGSYFMFKDQETARALSNFLKEIYNENVRFQLVELPATNQLHGLLYSVTY